ncbi:hypothetical protein SY83_07400 [Paenibacillus swuensis]|uniref:DUF2140 domain-containing protein n=1 Tax=Paenibacillus swuensis TaxID=1178515 RepID=A0A172TGE3_9BACL|nr:hypothetical protein [Paenibacillus swuensis]ANE46135.1 hypothetical protein SY83_07400 [Paenibacillus swuensis]
MKKAGIGLLSLFIVVALAGASMLYYIRPEKALDLSYDPLSLESKVMGMVQQRKLEMTITEPELNNLLKEWLSLRPLLSESWEITGAEGSLAGTIYTVNANLLYANRIPVNAVVRYQLVWASPDLVAEPLSIHLKDLKLSAQDLGLDPIVIPVGQQLPPGLNVKKVTFGDNNVTIRFGIRLFNAF